MNSIAFIKFGKKEHIESLVNEGKLFLNTVTEFKKIDDNYRGDKNEGASHLLQSAHARIEIRLPEEIRKEPLILDSSNGLIGQIVMSFGEYSGKNIYSLYMLEASESASIDSRMEQFGEYAAFIHNPKEFLNRVESKLKQSNISFEAGQVSYIDEQSFEGDLSLFKKFSAYKYQNEYRILISSKKNEPFILNIGPINDIAYALPVEIFHSMKISRIR